MTRRDRSAGRRPPTREARTRLLVVCGAERTEKTYFVGLRDSYNLRTIDVRFVEKPRSPDQVVTHARDHCDYRDFDETWCVVDVDRFEIDGRKVTAACAAADVAGIRMAVSNPCFEYWLLLHHINSTAPMPHCGEIQDRIRKHVPAYDKTNLRFRDFAAGVADAVGRAQQNGADGEGWRRNPATEVWRLVERFRTG